jgi:hypothetical protein
MHNVSTISRVIIHPKYRGIGLGEKLVHDTLPQAGTPDVEAIAVMAKYNPFFEKAGMQRIAKSTPNKQTTHALQQLRQLGFDTELLANEEYTQQKIRQTGKQPIINILTELSHKGTARKALIPLPTAYPTHQAFVEKLAQLNEADLAKTLKRLSFTSQTKVYLFWTAPSLKLGR